MFHCLQKLIEEVEEMLNNLSGVTSVHGRFYDLSSKYYRFVGNHALYYKDALRYLGCVDVKDLSGESCNYFCIAEIEKCDPAFDMDYMTFKCHANTFTSRCPAFTFSETEKQERAFTLGLAGLLGEGVYNFGELVSPLGNSHHASAPQRTFGLFSSLSAMICV